ncbi:MAG: LD-carboxypeptidase [Cyclobacteriaceae bacterium]|nr:LD-carboxypeptidase [Cyclobacteriaceae bacterium]
MLKPLLKGDRVVIISPAGFVGSSLQPAIDVLKSWGLEVEVGKYARSQKGYFAGTDGHRLEDLQWALDHPKVKAILFARGGYGTSRIIDQLNFNGFLKFPKWLIGFSDITALHLKVNQLGVPTIHGPMALQFGKKEYASSIEHLQQLLFTGLSTINVKGDFKESQTIQADITGGNLSLLIDSMATPNELNTRDRILFIEDIGEGIYKIDRMLMHLKRAGKLEEIKALIIGHFTNISDTSPAYHQTLYELIESTLARPDVPIVTHFPAGHEPENIALPLGLPAQLEISPTKAKLKMSMRS